MGRVIYALVTAFAIELGLYLFSGSSYAQSSLFILFTNPSAITSSSLFTIISGALLLLGATVIVIGSFWNVNIYAIYAGMAGVFLTFVAVLVHLWTFINGQFTSLNIGGASIWATIIVVPFLIPYIITLADYIRGNE